MDEMRQKDEFLQNHWSVSIQSLDRSKGRYSFCKTCSPQPLHYCSQIITDVKPSAGFLVWLSAPEPLPHPPSPSWILKTECQVKVKPAVIRIHWGQFNGPTLIKMYRRFVLSFLDKIGRFDFHKGKFILGRRRCMEVRERPKIWPKTPKIQIGSEMGPCVLIVSVLMI